MSDYKELIEMLRSRSKAIIHEDAKLVDITAENIWDADANALADAADAIEQLMNDYEILAKMYAKANEDLCVRTKERDAEVEETHRYQKCFSCRYIHVAMGEEPCLSCNQCWDEEEKCNWEWKGIEHE